jgi:hypothetical protein
MCVLHYHHEYTGREVTSLSALTCSKTTRQSKHLHQWMPKHFGLTDWHKGMGTSTAGHPTVRIFWAVLLTELLYTVDSRLSARGLTALRLNRGNVFFKKKIYFPWVSHLFKCFVCQSMLVYYILERSVLAFTSSIDILPLFFLNARIQI